MTIERNSKGCRVSHANKVAVWRRRKLWAAVGVVAILTTGLSVGSYYYSPSITVCDLTLQLDEGLVALNVPLVPIAAGESADTHCLLYRRGVHTWEAGKAGRMPWRNLPKVEAFANDSLLVGGFGYWLGGWHSDARPGRFIVLLMPLWAVTVSGLLAYLALQARRVRLRLWMFFVFTAMWAAGLAWLTRRAEGSL